MDKNVQLRSAIMEDSSKALAVNMFTSSAQDREIIQGILSEMLITVSDKHFKDQDVKVDGYRFINCRFENCKLVVARGTFELHHCIFEGTIARYDREALKAVRLYHCFGSPTPFAGFSPQKFPDKSVTVTADK